MQRARIGVLMTAMALLTSGGACTGGASASGIHDIQHVIVIMQENRSFDEYFGTYPGANGIPASFCMPDPAKGDCVTPYHNQLDINLGGPHDSANALADIDGAKMDGFIGQAETGEHCMGTDPTCSACNQTGFDGACTDVVGYHDAREIPNYWLYAENFALQDNLFASNLSWSLPEHLYMVSGWSASCKNGDTDPMLCVSSIDPHSPETDPETTYAWTDITYLLHKAGVTWNYYVFKGTEPDCESDGALLCEPVQQGPLTPSIWNPLPYFTDVREDGQLGKIKSLSEFYAAVEQPKGCSLPNVSWITPNGKVSEHPTASVSAGQTYVTTLIDAVMRSHCWDSTAIFLSWDDWGGFYDHVVPPQIDGNGYGLRVPGLVISAYAKRGYIDHQLLSHDAYLKFIEDDFLGSQSLDPATDGRPDKRPDVRERAPGMGDLLADFDFSQPPRPPLILPTHPAPGPASTPPGAPSVLPPQSATQKPENQAVEHAGATRLQLTASVAPRQDVRRHHGRIYLTVGCNEPCSLNLHGHLNLRRHRHYLRLHGINATLRADRARRLAIQLQPRTLAAIRKACARGRSVWATIAIDAGTADGAKAHYLVRVRLTYR